MVKKQKNFPKKHLFFVDILKATGVKRRIRGYGPLFRSADPDPNQTNDFGGSSFLKRTHGGSSFEQEDTGWQR
jgi:hypothetical protein